MAHLRPPWRCTATCSEIPMLGLRRLWRRLSPSGRNENKKPGLAGGNRAAVQVTSVAKLLICRVSSAVEQRFCKPFFLCRSRLFLCRKTRYFSSFCRLSTTGGSGRFGRTTPYYQAQKQAQLITVCSRIALVELDSRKRCRTRTRNQFRAFTMAVQGPRPVGLLGSRRRMPPRSPSRYPSRVPCRAGPTVRSDTGCSGNGTRRSAHIPQAAWSCPIHCRCPVVCGNSDCSGGPRQSAPTTARWLRARGGGTISSGKMAPESRAPPAF